MMTVNDVCIGNGSLLYSFYLLYLQHNIMEWVITVSYTHLDVYKRQTKYIVVGYVDGRINFLELDPISLAITTL